METVNIHCSACAGLIGIRRPNLGRHVRCPLCQKVIVATAPEPAPASPTPDEESSSAGPYFAPVERVEHESIFTPPEATCEDLFGESSAPLIEMPPEPPTVPEPVQLPLNAGDIAPTTTRPPEFLAAQAPEHFPEAGLPMAAGSAVPLTFADVPAARCGVNVAASETQSSEVQISTEERFVPAEVRRPSRPSQLVPILLIFLVPYSVLTTGTIAYLLWAQRSHQSDPLERMLEESGKQGKPGIKRVQHDLPLPVKLRAGLNESLQVGDVEARPLKVVFTHPGDLVLYLRLHNASRDLLFNPLPAKFTEYTRNTMAALKPYTFLEAGHQRVYGGVVQWWRGPDGKEQAADGDLKPGETETVRLVTDPQDRKLVAALLWEPGPVLWRVQLRRGLETIAGQDRVITCVIGVSFRLAQIEKS